MKTEEKKIRKQKCIHLKQILFYCHYVIWHILFIQGIKQRLDIYGHRAKLQTVSYAWFSYAYAQSPLIFNNYILLLSPQHLPPPYQPTPTHPEKFKQEEEEGREKPHNHLWICHAHSAGDHRSNVTLCWCAGSRAWIRDTATQRICLQ